MSKQTEALKLALHVMRNQGDIGVDEWLAAEKTILEALEKEALHKRAAESLNEGLRLDDWPKIGCVNHDCDKCKSQQEPVPCCGKYETCTQACTPRGRFLGKREALAEQSAPVQPFDHTAAANAALRDAQDRSYQIAKSTQPAPAQPLTDALWGLLDAVENELNRRAIPEAWLLMAHKAGRAYIESRGITKGNT